MRPREHERLMALRDRRRSHHLEAHLTSEYESYILYQEHLTRRAVAVASLLDRPGVPIWGRAVETERILTHIRGLPYDD